MAIFQHILKMLHCFYCAKPVGLSYLGHELWPLGWCTYHATVHWGV